MHAGPRSKRTRSLAGSTAGRCSLCDRTTPLTFHHLIPRKVHRRTSFQKNYARSRLARGIDICRLCHDGIHDLYDEMTLARFLRTPAQLRNDPRIRKHVAWVRKQKRR
jgi:hypothetical protein